MADVEIELTDDPAACRVVEDLQREAWGMSDRGIVPAEHIRAVAHSGGMLLLATHEGTPVGFCYAFLGVDGDEPIMYSHMLAVRPSEQSQGVGQALKLRQREVARDRGLRRVVWTFDPLQARNAYLNLHRLGAYARRYYEDHYGPMDDEINRGLPTDRLLAEWPVAAGGDPPVGDDAGGTAAGATAAWILPTIGAGPHPRPGQLDPAALGDGHGRIAVPADLEAIRRDDRDLVLAWRFAVRGALRAAFDAGLVAVDVDRDAGDGIVAYVLEARR